MVAIWQCGLRSISAVLGNIPVGHKIEAGNLPSRRPYRDNGLPNHFNEVPPFHIGRNPRLLSAQVRVC